MHLIGHFQDNLVSLFFKVSLHAKFLFWISVFIHIKIRTNYHVPKIAHLDVLW